MSASYLGMVAQSVGSTPACVATPGFQNLGLEPNTPETASGQTFTDLDRRMNRFEHAINVVKWAVGAKLVEAMSSCEQVAMQVKTRNWKAELLNKMTIHHDQGWEDIAQFQDHDLGKDSRGIADAVKRVEAVVEQARKVDGVLTDADTRVRNINDQVIFLHAKPDCRSRDLRTHRGGQGRNG